MDSKKRQFIKGAAIVGGTGLFAAGYSKTIEHLAEGALHGTSGKKPTARLTAIH